MHLSKLAGVLIVLLMMLSRAQAQCYPGLPCPDGPSAGAGNSGNAVPSDEAVRNTRPGSGGKYYYVGEVKPPDPWLALRSEPSSTSGYRIAKMPEGTLLRLIERKGHWWRVELTTGETGWAHSRWIKCCKDGQ